MANHIALGVCALVGVAAFTSIAWQAKARVIDRWGFAIAGRLSLMSRHLRRECIALRNYRRVLDDQKRMRLSQFVVMPHGSHDHTNSDESAQGFPHSVSPEQSPQTYH